MSAAPLSGRQVVVRNGGILGSVLWLVGGGLALLGSWWLWGIGVALVAGGVFMAGCGFLECVCEEKEEGRGT